jgi:GMP synthase (glutamine-hydrolysing)
MQILFIVHSDFEVPDYIQTWISNQNFKLFICRPFKGESLPPLADVDFVILTGGTHSLVDQDKYPYLKIEIEFVKQALAADKKILGICLGAQILSEAHGTKTELSPQPEIGVFPLRLTPEGINDPILEGVPSTFNVTHWHKYMPGLPNTASILAASEGCPRQIIRYSSRAYGFQCHIDTTFEDIQKAIRLCAKDFVPGKYIQDPNVFLGNDFTPMNEVMISVMQKLAQS